MLTTDQNIISLIVPFGVNFIYLVVTNFREKLWGIFRETLFSRFGTEKNCVKGN